MSKNYRNTLNLPQTDFPMKANLPGREPKILKHWQSIKLYERLVEQRQNRPRFILHDGPPYANGPIHIGHAVNKILKDIIIKFKTLQGFFVPYVPGWDCHGLPIELNVEKKVGKVGDRITLEAFREACRLYAQGQIEKQREAFIRLGVVGDWYHPYVTMDKKFEADVIRALAQVMANGYIKRGYKPVHWCIACRSALAEAEVEYQFKHSQAIDVRFRAVNPKAFASVFEVSLPDQALLNLPIWTTTPWTLPANQAVALNPDFSYVLLESQGEYWVIVESLWEQVMQRYDHTSPNVLARCLGKTLQGLKLKHPFLSRGVPIVLGTHVTADSGTGAVHTAPAHGQEDYMLAQQYALPVDTPVDDRGCFVDSDPFFPGMSVLKSELAIIEILKTHETLLHTQLFEHSYPHCWRHKLPLIFRATPQWFIAMDAKALRKKALEVVETTQWLPSWGKTRMAAMLSQRPDWCISRQRTWGTPLPLFLHKDTDIIHPRMQVWLTKIAERVEQMGLEAWDQLQINDLLDEDSKDTDIEQYKKVTDTLDVWFDSGVTHACVLNRSDHLSVPADLYLEGSDQHRGWFQSSLLTSVAMYDHAPYKTVLTHGFTVDSQGRKMSKSLGNVIAPEKIIQQLGADVLRLWVASTDYRAEMRISNEILKRSAEAYRRIRNTARFLLANLHDFDPNTNQIAPKDQLFLDRYILDRAYLVQEAIHQAYNAYQFHWVCHKLQHFCTVDLGGFYLDIIKDRQYTALQDSVLRRSGQTAMYHILCALVRWIAPILSFTAEEIYQHLPGHHPDSIFLAQPYKELIPLSESSPISRSDWAKIIDVRNAVNKQLEQARNEAVIGSSLDAEVYLFCDKPLIELLNRLKEDLHFLLITSDAQVLSAKDRHHQDKTMVVPTEILGLWIMIKASSYEKCVRCWHHQAEVGNDPIHPQLCDRCIKRVATIKATCNASDKKESAYQATTHQLEGKGGAKS